MSTRWQRSALRHDVVFRRRPRKPVRSAENQMTLHRPPESVKISRSFEASTNGDETEGTRPPDNPERKKERPRRGRSFERCAEHRVDARSFQRYCSDIFFMNLAS